MAAQVYGTAHLYGIPGTVSNATVSSASFEEVCANLGEVVDESGNAVERRYDDLTTEGTLTLIQRSAYTVPTPGTTLTYDGTEYEITKVGRRHEARGYRVVEIGLKKSEGVSLA